MLTGLGCSTMHGALEPLDLNHIRSPRDLTHPVFRFPGRFHPPLVTYLLNLHPDATLVGDPMVGCGTVPVEAAAAGKDGFYSDIDPLSCLLARAKSRAVDPTWLVETISSLAERAASVQHGGVRKRDAEAAMESLEDSTPFHAPPNAFHWFDPYVIVALCRILEDLSELRTTERRREALLAVIASAIRRVSRADPHTISGLEVTRIRLEELAIGLQFDVAAEVKGRARLLARGYRKLQRAPRIGRVMVVETDVRGYARACKECGMLPDLIITSPCYLSAIEYWRRHKLEYCWLGLVEPEDLPRMRRRFLGMGTREPDTGGLPRRVRRLHSRLLMRGLTREAKALARYFQDTATWIGQVAELLETTGGTAYIVTGPNTVRGERVNTPEFLRQISEERGLSAKTILRYAITNSHMQYPTKGEKRIKSETVLRLCA